mgnify:CR=1 FL=1
MKLDLESLSLKELKELQVSVERTISNFEDRKKREALAALEAVARENGFSLGELVGAGFPRGSGSKKSDRAPIAAKYMDPSNASNTWSGRGRKPAWFEAALKSGKTAEDMLIN